MLVESLPRIGQGVFIPARVSGNIPNVVCNSH